MKPSVKRLLALTLLALVFPASASARTILWPNTKAGTVTLYPGDVVRIPCFENAKSVFVRTPASHELHLDGYYTGSGGEDDWTTYYSLGTRFAAEGQADQGPDTDVKKTLVRNAGRIRIIASWYACTARGR